ncbi:MULTISPECIES: hypothetical protein [Cobetia]|uniref:DUF2282 domain-containing protein n=1 Tax=Cobetia marina TaxID=28258 RepID=A0ABU9GBY4_COBMA|nr:MULTISPECIES: hypothetical protein [Cobetia]MDA5564231.1 hypothetical protein [Cobetia sp. MMG027]MDH2290120.1 hypothetical protein [Cobetia sp. 10Alg 146]MDI6004219.1 hypothetical protein [Cobetia pacifica]MDN2656561.1 hypothetical protein [Cobetia sp. 14N.309.X.WAT.E.A4]
MKASETPSARVTFRRRGSLALMAGALLAISGMSMAQPPGGKPPQEAFDACASKQVGDQCQIAVPEADSLVPGHCVAPPQGGETACLPDDAKQGPKH